MTYGNFDRVSLQIGGTTSYTITKKSLVINAAGWIKNHSDASTYFDITIKSSSGIIIYNNRTQTTETHQLLSKTYANIGGLVLNPGDTISLSGISSSYSGSWTLTILELE
ncbi:hypothetical protein J3E07_001702 [Methanococcus voltae]|uniref:Uncharacterized protein n=1 Tax=Methanococcus voltae TaxID=2188 RepID=A0A8J7UVC0_METVO|nr:hypothetical protein [Methanococcus voltae]MBP2202261.1 hypothetical protein [Methanococcus voltae]